MVIPEIRFYQDVIIMTDDPDYVEVNGKRGAIIARGEEDKGRVEYGVFVYDEQEVWSIPGEYLIDTGISHKREDFYG